MILKEKLGTIILFFPVILFQFIHTTYFSEIENCKITRHGREYIGNVNQTKSGQKCLQWTKEILERLDLSENHFSDMDSIFTHNFCRNPGGYPYGPWCIVDDKSLTWKYCDIPSCIKDRNWCKDTQSGEEYIGRINITKSGKQCKPWNSQSNFRASLLPEMSYEDAGNKCRNPDGYIYNPWCYTVDQATRWEDCDVPKCDKSFSQIEYFGGYDFLKTIGQQLNIISLDNVYKNITFVVSSKLKEMNSEMKQKSSLWATDYDPTCQTDLNEYEYCQLSKVETRNDHMKLVYVCLRPLKNLIFVSPLSKSQYLTEYRLGDKYEINEELSSQFLAYQNKVLKNVNKINSEIIKIPVASHHGYFLLLEDNVIPYAITSENKVVMTVSIVGKGRVGFVASDKYIDEGFVSNIRHFLKTVYENETASPVRLNKDTWKYLYSEKDSINILSTYVIWNAHYQIGKDNTKVLLDLIKNGLRIIIGIKPWAYEYYRTSILSSELKSILVAAGIWPSINSASEVLTVLNSVVVETFPVVHLLDYARTNLPNALRVSDFISSAFIETPFNNLVDENNFKAISQNIRSLFPVHLYHIRSLIPCLRKPLENKNDKKLIQFLNGLLLHSFDNRFVAPGLSFYPGIIQDESVKDVTVKLKLNMKFSDEVVQLGLYIPPGRDVSVKITKSKSQTCELYVNFHLFNVLNKDQWDKWPITNTKYILERDKLTTFSFAFGGLLSLLCKETENVVDITFTGVKQIPIFDRRDDEINKNWNKYQQLSSPWAVISSDTVVFILSSNAIRNLGRPNEVLELYDMMVKEELHLRGKSVSENRREIISTDIQILAGYMHAGYPVGTMIYYVTNPDFTSKYLFDKSNIKKEGRWGILHEIGHNLQDQLFTFSGTVDITNNVFTLVAIEQMTGDNSWSPNVGWLKDGSEIKRFLTYINTGTFSEWQSEPFLGLGTYAQLKNSFGWELFSQIFRRYNDLSKTVKSLTEHEKIQLWINETSIHTKMNLSPFYELWRWPVDKELNNQLSKFTYYLPEDFLTKMIENKVNEIIKKYGGPSSISRVPLKIPIIVGPLKNAVKIEGSKIIQEILVLE